MSLSQIKEQLLYFNYRFSFPSGKQKIFSIYMDPVSLDVLRVQSAAKPDWAKLNKFMCPNCPLESASHRYCPLALNLVDIVDFFKDTSSYERVEITVETKDRMYRKKTDVQSGLSSIMGILMVGSGCPIVGRLKSMVRFHLPFATIDETEVKTISIYLLSQYVQYKKGLEPDWTLTNLKKIYSDIETVNRNIASKLAEVERHDANVNSVIILNNFAAAVHIYLDDMNIDKVESFVKEFTKSNS
jgi:hypothetical protein